METPETDRSIRTTCPYCGVGCGVLATPDGKGGLSIAGDPEHPANFGRLCSKGSALGETVGLDGRLLHPMRKTADGDYTQIGWDEALDQLADYLHQTAREHGPEAVAFYLSGQLLTEDYYVANKLAKGFLGTPHVDTNSRLCMASSVAGHRRAFGSDTVPQSYADLDEADLIVLVGSNAAWCHPVLFQRMLKAKQEHATRIVVIDPRRTASAEDADLFLPIKAGTDTILFSGLLVHLAETGGIDVDYIARHTDGFMNALETARSIAPDPASVAARTGLSQSEVETFYALWRKTQKVVTAWSQGVNQAAHGTDKVGAIINCHLAAGRIGLPGCGPLSLTGQPNAMGGREVGGLANMLAAHMGFSSSDIDRVRRFWAATNIVEHEGLKAVSMFKAMEEGRIRGLWVMATNPAVSLPRADRVRGAMAKLDWLVVSDNQLTTDTIASGADLILPAAAWAEKDGTVTNSERRISRQRASLPLPGEVKPDWWMICEIGKRLGFEEAFAFDGPAAIFREHAALSGFENHGTRDFDIGGLAHLDDAGYEALAPVQWPVLSPADTGEKRFFAEGGFYTPDGKARFIVPAAPVLAVLPDDQRPLLLNTGRVRDQWHTMTRTGRSPRLGLHRPEPYLEIHPEDALAYGIENGGLARVFNSDGDVILRAVVTQTQQPGSVFAPIHWNDQTASHGRIGSIVHAVTDPFSGQPDLKATPVCVEPLSYAYHGFILGEAMPELPAGSWWSKVAIGRGSGILFATDAKPGALAQMFHAHFTKTDLAEFADKPAGVYRCAVFKADRVVGALFVAPAGRALAWDAAKALYELGTLDLAQRRAILSGKALDGAQAGPIVCACFGVGLKTIADAIANGTATNVEAIGTALKAGTNCGSCIPEIKRLIGQAGEKTGAGEQHASASTRAA